MYLTADNIKTNVKNNSGEGGTYKDLSFKLIAVYTPKDIFPSTKSKTLDYTVVKDMNNLLLTQKIGFNMAFVSNYFDVDDIKDYAATVQKKEDLIFLNVKSDSLVPEKLGADERYSLNVTAHANQQDLVERIRSIRRENSD